MNEVTLPAREILYTVDVVADEDAEDNAGGVVPERFLLEEMEIFPHPGRRYAKVMDGNPVVLILQRRPKARLGDGGEVVGIGYDANAERIREKGDDEVVVGSDEEFFIVIAEAGITEAKSGGVGFDAPDVDHRCGGGGVEEDARGRDAADDQQAAFEEKNADDH